MRYKYPAVKYLVMGASRSSPSPCWRYGRDVYYCGGESAVVVRLVVVVVVVPCGRVAGKRGGYKGRGGKGG